MRVAKAIVEQLIARVTIECQPYMSKAFEYHAIATGSNYAPLLLEVFDGAGRPTNVEGATFTVVIKDESTGETLVQDGEAAVSTSNPYLIEYYFAPETVAKITHESTWLVEWTITAASGRVHRIPVPCRLPVRLKL